MEACLEGVDINEHMAHRVVQLALHIQSLRKIATRILAQVNFLHACSLQLLVQFVNLAGQLGQPLVGILSLQVDVLVNLELGHDVDTTTQAEIVVEGYSGIDGDTRCTNANTNTNVRFKELS